ncbi:MAG: rRNA maturation RNase YbeY [Bellilinea sp.]
MIHIYIDPQFENFVPADLLERAAVRTLALENFDITAEFSVVIEKDEKLQQLNRDFLGIDAPTDVLSFPSEEFDPDEQAPYIGDIIISFPRAELQANDAGHPVINEIQLLVVHGTLHLLGYDHAEPDEKEKMWAAQAAIITDLDCQINQLPE